MCMRHMRAAFALKPARWLQTALVHSMLQFLPTVGKNHNGAAALVGTLARLESDCRMAVLRLLVNLTNQNAPAVRDLVSGGGMQLLLQLVASSAGAVLREDAEAEPRPAGAGTSPLKEGGLDSAKATESHSDLVLLSLGIVSNSLELELPSREALRLLHVETADEGLRPALAFLLAWHLKRVAAWRQRNGSASRPADTVLPDQLLIFSAIVLGCATLDCAENLETLRSLLNGADFAPIVAPIVAFMALNPNEPHHSLSRVLILLAKA